MELPRLRVLLTVLLGAFFLASAAVPRAQAVPMHFHRKPTSGHARKASSRAHGSKLHGQQNIDTDRAKQIQTALVREHYMTAEPTGVWDQSSKDAMVRYQADHGWQTKVTPDSRALIKLGLGPEQPAGAPVAVASAHPAAAPPAAAPQSHTLGSAISAHSSGQTVLLP